MAQDRLEKNLFRDLLPALFHQPPHRLAMFPEGDWFPGEAGTPRWSASLPMALPRRDGVHLFGIRWSDALVSPGRHEQMLMTRYDPRDLSRIWVRRSDGRHVEARYKNLANPSCVPS